MGYLHTSLARASLLKSALRDKTEDGANQQHERFLAGASSIPPGIGTVVQGMQFRPQMSEMVSSVGLASIAHGVPLKSISDRKNGAPIDLIGGRSAVQSQYNAFYVELSKDVLAIVSPRSTTNSPPSEPTRSTKPGPLRLDSHV